MHIPDGFLSTPVWAALDVVSLPVVGWAARRSGQDAAGHRVPLLGVMGAFVFAAQMINFPVGLGTSAHLVGGALLACVLGPASAVVTMTAILVLQALIFQDGGVLVLGANVFNMALAGVAAGYLPLRVWGRTTAAIFAGGVLSVLVSGALALAELLASGVAVTPHLVWLACGLFLASGLAEGAITVAAVRAIERLRPDALAAAGIARTRAAVALAALLLAVAGVVFASTHPDSLQYLAAQLGLREAPEWWRAPLAGYDAAGFGGPWARKAAAGVIGCVLVYAAFAIRTRKRASASSGS